MGREDPTETDWKQMIQMLENPQTSSAVLSSLFWSFLPGPDAGGSPSSPILFRGSTDFQPRDPQAKRTKNAGHTRKDSFDWPVTVAVLLSLSSGGIWHRFRWHDISHTKRGITHVPRLVALALSRVVESAR
jgi:hypothetical protein